MIYNTHVCSLLLALNVFKFCLLGHNLSLSELNMVLLDLPLTNGLQ